MSYQKKRPTISDIAKAAGVSKTTVSRYINGRFDLMSAETRKRLHDIIKMTNYKPSDVARSLKSQRSRLIGVIISDISTPFSSALISGISSVFDSAGYVPLFVNCNNNAQKERAFIRDLVSRGVEGLLVNTCSYENPDLIEMECKGLPVVLCDRPVKDYNFNIVTSEVVHPISSLISHLKSQGFSVPYFFTQQLSSSSVRMLRHDAFIDSIEKIYDVADPIEYIRNTRIDKQGITKKYLNEILTQTQGTPAVLGSNTMTTIHLINELSQIGAKIPYDIGVCGPDDWSWGQQLDWAGLILPGITTYVIESDEIGRQSAKLLLDIIRNPQSEKTAVYLKPEIIIRSSTLLKG